MGSGARGRHLGLDVGDRRIGVALSDETATLASALTTLRRSGPGEDAAAVVILQEHLDALKAGPPLATAGRTS